MGCKTPNELDASARGLARRLTRRMLRIQDSLPGIADRDSLNSLALEIAWSQTTIIELRTLVASGKLSGAHSPSSRDWEPYSAIVSLHKKGDIEEATWLAFLTIHIGPRRDSGWLSLRTVYAGLDEGLLDWDRMRDDPAFITGWCVRHAEELRRLRLATTASLKAGSTSMSWCVPTSPASSGAQGAHRRFFLRPAHFHRRRTSIDSCAV